MPNLNSLRHLVQWRLGLLVPSEHAPPQRMHHAIRYSLLAPGKRIRPLLCMLTAYGAGRADTAALDAGCAIEMVHTASLVIDDLPSMDDAQYRRGQLSAHRRFGESTAILSAIALLNQAFGLLSTIDGIDDRTRIRLVALMSSAVGSAGLVAGQEHDLHDRAFYSDLTSMDTLNRLKTGVLFAAAAEFGALVAGLQDEEIIKLSRFTELFGLAFQTADDLLDTEGSLLGTGKDVRQDGNKPTVVSITGIEQARKRVFEQLNEARAALAACRFDTGPLITLLDDFAGRPTC